MVKPENVLRGETTNRHTAFKITIRGHFHKEIFSFLDRMILSFFFGPVFFLSLCTMDFLPLLISMSKDFSMSKNSTCEFCNVRDVNKVWK